MTVKTDRRVYFFADNVTPKACFAAAAKLRHDVIWSGVEPRQVRPRHIAYHLMTSRFPAECWCVDIKAAYPTALLNLGAIKRETYDKLAKLKKEDRLKAVGMLATRKFVQTYVNGRLCEQRVDEAATAPFFYTACDEIGQVMVSLRQTLPGFVFFWVDGVFVETDDPRPIVDTLESMGYRATAERVTDIRLSQDGTALFYAKGNKRTYLSLPRRIEYHDADIITAIHNAVDL